MGSRKRHARPNATTPVKPRAGGGLTSVTPAWAVAALAFLAAVLVYLPTLDARFIWDDEYAISVNPLMQSLNGLWRIWTTVGQIPQEVHYWPLTYSAFWLQWQCWGDWAPGFHLVNILLNGAIVVQIWRLARRIGLPGGWLIALLFALHPAHVEAVAWVTSLKDLLATLGSLLVVEFYLNREERGGVKWLVAAAAMLAAAMLCKSMPVSLPAGLAILVWCRRGRFTKRELAALALLGAIALTIALADTWLTNRAPSSAEVIAPPLAERLAQSGLRFWLYAGKLVWPVGLSPIYPQWALDTHHAIAWLPLAGIVVVTAGLWIARRRIGRGPLACWLFYGVTLGPILGILHFTFLGISPIADRYQYLASLGPIAGVGVLAGRWLARRQWRGTGVCMAAALLIALAALTWRHECHFHDDETAFKRAMAIAPESLDAPYNLGVHYMKQARHAEAVEMFERAIRIKPDYWRAVCNISNILMIQGRDREAAALCRDAIGRGCMDPGVVNNLALVLITTKDSALRNPAEALDVMLHGVAEARRNEPGYLSILSQVQMANGLYGEALVTARKALVKAREAKMNDVIPVLEETIRTSRQRTGQ